MSIATLDRTTFRTSRFLDFATKKELTAQIGHQPEVWPLVVLKELVDNALDACEEAGIAPEITVAVDETGIMVTDNGPGIPESTIADVLDFTVRVSSREAYIAPDRGAQGNGQEPALYAAGNKTAFMEVLAAAAPAVDAGCAPHDFGDQHRGIAALCEEMSVAPMVAEHPVAGS